ncbi:transposable element Tcb2 transposase [Trichonephila clavipes]|nr:transposable element Tcb2 transposase [Trichonephila clavipes]
MLNGRTELHIFDRGSVTGDRYCEEVLLSHVRLFRGAIGPDFIFMDDNARPHLTLAVEEMLESEDITRMDLPAYFPDLNSIEHVWDALGRRIAARLHHPESTQQLKQMLIEEWALLPQERLHQLVLGMRRRYGTSEALDIPLVSPELPPHCDWDILSIIGSDHFPILTNVQINRKTVTSHKKFWNFKKANWDCFQRITEGSFDKRTTMDNLEKEWHSFKQVIIHASKQSIPRGNFKHLKSYFQHRDPGLRTLILKRNSFTQKTHPDWGSGG